MGTQRFCFLLGLFLTLNIHFVIKIISWLELVLTLAEPICNGYARVINIRYYNVWQFSVEVMHQCRWVEHRTPIWWLKSALRSTFVTEIMKWKKSNRMGKLPKINKRKWFACPDEYLITHIVKIAAIEKTIISLVPSGKWLYGCEAVVLP